MYRYEILDPRPIPAAVEANEKVFASGTVYGIEVTVPALAARCAYNLDPQHSGGDATTAAIKAALTEVIPLAGAILATVRADLDGVGAMTVFALRAKGVTLSPETEARIRSVAAADTFARGNWPGQQPLPTRDNPWPASGSAEGTRELAAMAAAVADFKVPLAQRVAVMEHWLMTGEEPESYRSQVERERHDLIAAIEAGEVKITRFNLITAVETTHRAATMIGYLSAPIVVALNPAFRFGGGEPHRKFTVCQYTAGYVDLKAIANELASLEAGWGGSPTIIGSPQGVGSILTIDDVVMMVERHYV
ncbi:MAG TPA: hypothetical protein VN420_00880 [Candidatus Fimivivens sp.]|nr:hypothetical protein [Candidatus Fimivivens sp.]